MDLRRDRGRRLPTYRHGPITDAILGKSLGNDDTIGPVNIYALASRQQEC